ncbi:major facilitator superfamily domain-containing protein [Echria macrotheca]|uniref:Major facilitator superfamily domain-containing protein n=1 Tax=Echria macrotheca TaxID=438768 RepID=A0AAJ0BKR2_9PEZI|nr:major facilitator superfamily domain-containing protein [Echria macrotheca]
MERTRDRFHPALTTAGFGGVQVVFSLISGQAVTHLTSLGLSKSAIAILLAGLPLCGTICQPYFGSWSDQSALRWGRRRPFIVAGTAVLVSSLCVLAWADLIIQGLFSDLVSPESLRLLLVLLAMLSTLAMFIAIQAIIVGQRAVITDNRTIVQQSEAHTWAGRHINISGTLGYLAAFLNHPEHVVGVHQTAFSRTTVPTIVFLVFAVGLTCYCNPEKQRTTLAPGDRHEGSLKLIRQVFFGPSSNMRTIFIIQFLSWLGWFPFLYYIVSFEPRAGFYTAVHTIPGALAPLSYSTVSLFTALLLPNISATDTGGWTTILFRPQNLWLVSNLIFGFAMLGTIFVNTATGTVLLFSVVGISWAITHRVPYSLLGDELSQESPEGRTQEDLSRSHGLVYGVHYMAICLPQIFIMSVMSVVWMSADMTGGSALGVVWFLRLGGVSALLAAYCTTRLEQATPEKGRGLSV